VQALFDNPHDDLRWTHDPKLGFPRAIVINRQNYRRIGELRRWEREREREAA
jgi:hypothetical protein